jgi:endonuclease YncB( thermonuclease family)
MSSETRWRWAGIVSAVSVGGVLITDIVANVVGGYISDQIKTWDVPDQAPAQHAPANTGETVSSIPPPASEGQVTMAAVAPKPSSAPMPEVDIGEPAPDADAESEAARAPEPMPLPPPQPQPMPLSGTVEQVIDTATLKIGGETIELAGIKGLGSPYRDQLAKFIEEQGSLIRCEPIDERYVCFVKNVDLGLAALTNGAAQPAADATPQYQQASDEARRNRRGIFQ